MNGKEGARNLSQRGKIAQELNCMGKEGMVTEIRFPIRKDTGDH
jgi:hypothetical protein